MHFSALHSQNDYGDLRGVARGGELGCLCGKAGTSHLCDGSAHSSGCVVNGSNAMAAFIIIRVMPPIFGCGKLNSFPSTFMKINKNSSSPRAVTESPFLMQNRGVTLAVSLST